MEEIEEYFRAILDDTSLSDKSKTKLLKEVSRDERIAV